jgi:hypothetical protein
VALRPSLAQSQGRLVVDAMLGPRHPSAPSWTWSVHSTIPRGSRTRIHVAPHPAGAEGDGRSLRRKTESNERELLMIMIWKGRRRPVFWTL